MKTIYWIDDDVEKIVYIIQGVILQLWNLSETKTDEKTATKILIFGNDSQESQEEYLYTDKDIMRLKNYIADIMFGECRRIEGPSWENQTYDNNLFLITDSVKCLFKKLDEGVTEDEKTENDKKLEIYKKIKEYWQSGQEVDVENLKENAENIVKELIQLMDIESGACVGIDLALLKGDREKVLEGKGPIISMELYNQLKENHPCFIYSTYIFEAELLSSCKEIFKKHYGGDIDILKRSELMLKCNSNFTINQIKEKLKNT